MLVAVTFKCHIQIKALSNGGGQRSATAPPAAGRDSLIMPHFQTVGYMEKLCTIREKDSVLELNALCCGVYKRRDKISLYIPMKWIMMIEG